MSPRMFPQDAGNDARWDLEEVNILIKQRDHEGLAPRSVDAVEVEPGRAHWAPYPLPSPCPRHSLELPLCLPPRRDMVRACSRSTPQSVSQHEQRRACQPHRGVYVSMLMPSNGKFSRRGGPTSTHRDTGCLNPPEVTQSCARKAVRLCAVRAAGDELPPARDLAGGPPEVPPPFEPSPLQRRVQPLSGHRPHLQRGAARKIHAQQLAPRAYVARHVPQLRGEITLQPRAGRQNLGLV